MENTETRVTIAMEETLLRDLKRVARKEGIPVPKLLAETILDHLEGSKTSAMAGRGRRPHIFALHILLPYTPHTKV